MASVNQVKTYLAYWFQLGRGVWIPGHADLVKPARILSDNAYSVEFETLWAKLATPSVSAHSYLEGTEQTIDELLSPMWEVESCARCSLPIPLKTAGLPPTYTCPCADMGNLPNLEMIPPREPVNSQLVLQRICDRLSHLGFARTGSAE
jgi:hypothetical protein